MQATEDNNFIRHHLKPEGVGKLFQNAFPVLARRLLKSRRVELYLVQSLLDPIKKPDTEIFSVRLIPFRRQFNIRTGCRCEGDFQRGTGCLRFCRNSASVFRASVPFLRSCSSVFSRCRISSSASLQSRSSSNDFGCVLTLTPSHVFSRNSIHTQIAPSKAREQ